MAAQDQLGLEEFLSTAAFAFAQGGQQQQGFQRLAKVIAQTTRQHQRIPAVPGPMLFRVLREISSFFRRMHRRTIIWTFVLSPRQHRPVQCNGGRVSSGGGQRQRRPEVRNVFPKLEVRGCPLRAGRWCCCRENSPSRDFGGRSTSTATIFPERRVIGSSPGGGDVSAESAGSQQSG